MWSVYERTQGLTIDKLKAVLMYIAKLIEPTNIKGIVFAYDEAQNLSDFAEKDEFPLSLILDAFSYVQRQQMRCQFMLVLTGLPTLIPKLNESRTFSEMFHTLVLDRLSHDAAQEAIIQPIKLTKSTLTFADGVVSGIVEMSRGYPYFIQFICKEVFGAWIGKMTVGLAPSVPME